MNKVTIYDVAKRAKVSIATASRALNPASQSGPVSDETRERVLNAARELNYVARVSGYRSAPRPTRVIGLVLPDVSNPFFAEIAQGVVKHACDLKYEVIIAVSTNEYDGPMRQNERGAAHTLLRRRVDGIIAVPIGDQESERVWKSVLSRGLPLVFVDRDMQEAFPDIDAVAIDNKEGVLQAMRQLFLNGHERIAILTGPLSASTLVARLDAFKKAYVEAKKPLDEDLIQESSFGGDSRYRAARRILGLPNRPTAIFASSNLLGEAVLFAAQERGLRIPQDLSLVMFDDVHWARFTTPQITTIAHEPRGMADAAVDLLLQRLNATESVEPRRLILPSAELRLRGSIQRLTPS